MVAQPNFFAARNSGPYAELNFKYAARFGRLQLSAGAASLANATGTFGTPATKAARLLWFGIRWLSTPAPNHRSHAGSSPFALSAESRSLSHGGSVDNQLWPGNGKTASAKTAMRLGAR